MNTQTFDIPSTDYWFQVIDMGYHNWALITPNNQGGVTAHFFTDKSGVFDRLSFPTQTEAETALKRNGFNRYAEEAEFRSLIQAPSAPFHEAPDPSGPVYSAGRFWK